jgi:hypothetical protein
MKKNVDLKRYHQMVNACIYEKLFMHDALVRKNILLK